MAKRLRISAKVVGLASLIYLVIGFVAVRLAWDPVRLSPSSGQGVALPPLAPPAPGTVVRGAISVHTGRSHDAEGTLDEVARAAAESDLDFVLLGDHVGDWASEGPVSLDPRRVEGVLLVPGMELAVQDAGRVLAVGLDTLPREWLGSVDELVARVRDGGGFLSVVHPRSPRARESWRGLSRPGIDAWESFDVSEMARMRVKEPLAGYRVAALLTALATGQGHRSLTRLWREGTRTPALLAYDSARAREPVVLTGGLNHHPKTRLMGRLFPAYQPFFRTVVNHVLLDRPLDPDPRTARHQVLSSLRRGRLFVTLGDAEGVVDFGVLAVDDGGEAVAMGEAVPWTGAARLVVALPADARGRMPVRILRDGVEAGWIQGTAGERLQWEVPGPGVYRVEVFKGGLRIGGVRAGFQPWILSNPIELTPPDPARVAGGS